MLVDLSGYTALSATLDPEDTNRLPQRFFDLVDSLVLNFGGTIDKHIGDSVGQRRLKGLAGPQAMFRLVGLRADATQELAMVGRHGDLAQLLSLVTAARTTGSGGAAVIRGVPGIGKSRLLREVTARAKAIGVTCVSGLVPDFGAQVGEDVLATITAGLLGTAPVSLAHSKIRAVADAVTSARIAPEDRPLILDLLSLPQPADSQTVYAAMDAGARRHGMAAALVR